MWAERDTTTHVRDPEREREGALTFIWMNGVNFDKSCYERERVEPSSEVCEHFRFRCDAYGAAAIDRKLSLLSTMPTLQFR